MVSTIYNVPVIKDGIVFEKASFLIGYWNKICPRSHFFISNIPDIDIPIET